VPFPPRNTVFTPHSHHIHSKTPQNDRSTLHSVHRSRTGPRERPKAAHNRHITWADRPPGPEPRGPTFVAAPPPLAHMDSGGWRTDGIGSDNSTSAAAAAVPPVFTPLVVTAARGGSYMLTTVHLYMCSLGPLIGPLR
jgi:hypothetical protein